MTSLQEEGLPILFIRRAMPMESTRPFPIWIRILKVCALLILVDFDMLYGHRNDIEGYAKALTAFDEALPEIMHKMREDDLLMITADHGCDPGYTVFHGSFQGIHTACHVWKETQVPEIWAHERPLRILEPRCSMHFPVRRKS